MPINIEKGHMTLTIPFGWFITPRLAMTNLRTKVGMSIFTHAEYKKATQNLQMGWFEVIRVTGDGIISFDRLHSASY